MQKKKRWARPNLIVLSNTDTAHHSVLAGCKTLSEVGPNTTVDRCLQMYYDYYHVCTNPCYQAGYS